MAKAPAPAFTIREDELLRLPVPRGSRFPWNEPAAVQIPAAPAVPVKPAPAGSDALMDVTAGDVWMEGFGPITRVEKEAEAAGGKKAMKENLTLQVDLAKYPQRLVEIVQKLPPPGQGANVLRGQTIRLVRDVATGQMETLESLGAVQVVTPPGPGNPGRSAKGEYMLFETQYGPQRQLLKNMVTVKGDRDARKPARMWVEADTIEAYKVEMDLRLDTFRAMGGVNAQVKMNTPAPNAAPAAPAPAAPAGMGGMLPGLSLARGGVVVFLCDGEMYYEGAAGRVKGSRNVAIKQEGLLMQADEMNLLLQQADAGQAAGSIFSGNMKSIECNGRVAIVTPTQVIQCDRMFYDLIRETLRLETRKLDDEVKIYFRDPAFPAEMRAVQILTQKHRIDIDTKTGTMVDIQDEREKVGVHPTSIKPFKELIPPNRPTKSR